MNPKRSRSVVPIFIVIVVIAAIAVAGYLMDRKASREAFVPTGTAATSTDATPSSTLPDASASTGPISGRIPLPSATSTVDTSSWKTYTDKARGYSFQYPSDLVSSTDAGILTLTFPKNLYFRWPLLDDATLKVTAIPTCPGITASGLGGGVAPISFSLNGYVWKRTNGLGAAAGNLYLEIAYDTLATSTSGQTCYHIGFLDHGANGAGLYVDDASLIRRYDAAHEADLAAVIDDLNAIVASFRILAASK